MTGSLLCAWMAAGVLLGAAEEKSQAPPSPPPAEATAEEEEARARAAGAAERKARDEARRARAEATDKAREERDRARAERDKARDQAREERDKERARQAALYEQAMQQLYDKEWEKAAAVFSEITEKQGRRADAALYWKAYAEAKKGDAARALATLERLRTEFPDSRWQRQARALAFEIRPGDSPAASGDDELQLLLLGRQLDRNPARSIASLEKLLESASSSRGAERALFLLSQSDSDEARQLLLRIARGEANPRLQKKAIEYVGLFGSAESRRVLETVYSGAASRDVKRAVLRSYLLSGNKAAVLAAARSEQDEALRAEAIRLLGVMGARRELAALAGAESPVEARKAALRALSLTGDSETLVEIARTDKDPALQAEAARTLGFMSREKTGPALVAICRESKDEAVRRAALQALFLQQNDQALVQVARAEKDPALRREAVRYLSLLGSSLSREFLSEILDK